MVFWNSLDICEPSTQLCNVSTAVFRKSDLMKIESTISSASLTLKKLSQLHFEAALVSRILYKQKMRFRHDKGLKKLEKVNRGLLKYLAFDIASVYKKFGKLLPKQPEDFEFVVPSKQILEWVLVKTQGFAKLFCVIADTCEETACFWKANIQSGNMCNISLMIMGVVGRIWTYARFLVQSACTWFAELRPYLTILQLKGAVWLPKGYTIPEDLKTWLKSPQITNATTGLKSQRDNTNKRRIFDLIGLEDMLDDEKPYLADVDVPLINSVGVEDRGETLPQKKTNTESKISLTTHAKLLSTEMEDLGEAVPQSVYKAKDKIWAFANSTSMEDFGKKVAEIKISRTNKKRMRDGSVLATKMEDKMKMSMIDDAVMVSRNTNKAKDTIISCADAISTEDSGNKFAQTDTRTESKISRKNKKRKHDGSALEDINESKFSSDTDSNIIRNGFDFTSEIQSSKKKKKRQKKKKNSLLNLQVVTSNHLEMTNSTESTSNVNKNNKEKYQVQMFSLDKSNSNESERKINTSKRKRKKKSKLDRQLSLINALSNPNKCANKQLSKKSKKKKGKNQPL